MSRDDEEEGFLSQVHFFIYATRHVTPVTKFYPAGPTGTLVPRIVFLSVAPGGLELVYLLLPFGLMG